MTAFRLAALLGVFAAGSAHAACVAGLCADGTSGADLQAAIDSAPDGATLRFAPGSYGWDVFVSFSNDRGITLSCESGACVVTASRTVLGMNGTLSGTNDKLYRISGFTFTGGMAGTNTLWFYGAGRLTRLRIDHNTFRDYTGNAAAILLGETGTVGDFAGVVDHNTLSGADNFALVSWVGAQPPPLASSRGTADNLFIEDNVLSFSALSNPAVACTEVGSGARVVWRHNSSTNCLVAAQGVLFAGGTLNFELYANQLAIAANAPGFEDGYRLFHHEGSAELIAFDNTFTAPNGKSSVALSVTHYRSAPPAVAGYSGTRCDGTAAIDGNLAPATTFFGYPCWHQPGRDASGALQPMYFWNNRWSDGSPVPLAVENPWNATGPSVATHVAANRDYWDGVPSGPLAGRPASCQPSNQLGSGPGFFATDEGRLYRCSAANTWTVHYTPYPYPHPLQGLGGGDAPVGDDPHWAVTCGCSSADPLGIVLLLLLRRFLR